MFITKTLTANQTILKSQQYWALLKARLSGLVVFSGGFGYLLANDSTIDWKKFLLFCLSSFLITGAANIINQVIEKDLDKLMKRTANRPLPTGRLQNNEAIIFSILLGLSGSLLLMFFVNTLAASLSLISLILYGFVYTPLKQKSPIAVFVGAFPGAFPPLIGWVACQGELSMGAFIIFGIQFIWQFPHFWAIAWVGEEDYKRAGFKLLPSVGGRDSNSAFQIVVYTLFLIPMGLLPMYFGLTGVVSAVVATFCAILFLIPAIKLMRDGSQKSALLIMFSSFIYLPIVQIAFLMDKL